jgi:hypothetical protein
MAKKKRKIPYSEKTDIEKIKSNCNKARGLYKRNESSASIVRSATAAEIAANLVIREELQVKRKLEEHFVDSLLIWANGIQGKFDRLILPIVKGSDKYDIFNSIRTKVNTINKERNSVAHSGQFKKGNTAKEIYNLSKEVIETMINQYTNDFSIKGIR